MERIETYKFQTVLELLNYLKEFKRSELETIGWFGADFLNVAVWETTLTDGSKVTDLSLKTESNS